VATSVSKIEDATTGVPFDATLLRGTGGSSRSGEAISGTGSESLLGGGVYGTSDRTYAEFFATNQSSGKIVGKVQDIKVSINNPLVISSDDEWRALTSAAGWSYPMPSVSNAPTLVPQLRNLIEGMGYDGVIVKVDPDQTRSVLQRMFGSSQAVSFAPASDIPLRQAADAAADVGRAVEPTVRVISDDVVRVGDRPTAQSPPVVNHLITPVVP
jgi:hypothetical protein